MQLIINSVVTYRGLKDTVCFQSRVDTVLKLKPVLSGVCVMSSSRRLSAVRSPGGNVLVPARIVSAVQPAFPVFVQAGRYVTSLFMRL